MHSCNTGEGLFAAYILLCHQVPQDCEVCQELGDPKRQAQASIMLQDEMPSTERDLLLSPKSLMRLHNLTVSKMGPELLKPFLPSANPDTARVTTQSLGVAGPALKCTQPDTERQTQSKYASEFTRIIQDWDRDSLGHTLGHQEKLVSRHPQSRYSHQQAARSAWAWLGSKKGMSSSLPSPAPSRPYLLPHVATFVYKGVGRKRLDFM